MKHLDDMIFSYIRWSPPRFPDDSHVNGRTTPVVSLQVTLDNWFARNAGSIKTAIRVIFGLVWAVDGSLKLQPGFADSFSELVSGAGSGQPAWLSSWYSFWASTTATNPAFFVYTTAFLELALAFCLITGFLRKLAYTGGLFLSLMIWAIPEGFGGPYSPSSTDIGTGVIYALVFLFLLVANATFGPSKYSLDRLIEKRWPGWRRIAEIRSGL